MLSIPNALLEYLTVLLEYIDLCAKAQVLNVMVIFWLICIATLMLYHVSSKVVWPWPYQLHHRCRPCISVAI